MAYVVFLRGVNVGGKNVFRPAQLAVALADLDVVNVGAAGTFVVRAKASEAAIRREILARLPFEVKLAVVPGDEVIALARSKPFQGVAISKGARAWAAAMHGQPSASPKLPLATPVGDAWSVRFDRVAGSFALGIWRRQPMGFVFPNQVVEKALGVVATTRWWETLERIAAILAKTPDPKADAAAAPAAARGAAKPRPRRTRSQRARR